MREMQDPENGVPVRSQKLFLTSIPSAFMGEHIRHFRKLRNKIVLLLNVFEDVIS